MDCRLQKLMFPYEWLDSYEKSSHVVQGSYEDFYCSLQSTIARDKYGQLLKLFKENDCNTMGDRLRLHIFAEVVSFIETFKKFLAILS